MSSDETGFEANDSTVVADDEDTPLAVLDSRRDESEEESCLVLFLSDTGSDRPLSVELKGAVGAPLAAVIWLRATERVAFRPSSA